MSVPFVRAWCGFFLMAAIAADAPGVMAQPLSADAWRTLPVESGLESGGVLASESRESVAQVILSAPQSVRKAAAEWLERRVRAGYAEVDDFQQLGRLYGAIKDHASQERALWAGLNRYQRDEDLYQQLIELYDPTDGEVSPIKRPDDQFQRVVARLMRDAPESRIGRVVRGTYSLEFGYLPEAQLLFESVLEENPLDADGIEGLAQVYLRQRETDRARSLIESVLAQRPNDTQLMRVAEALYRSANENQRADELAERRYRLIADPIERSEELSRFFAARERFESSADALREALANEAVPIDRERLELWAGTLTMAGAADKGIEQIDALAEQRGLNDALTGSARATLLAAAGRWTEAEKLLLAQLEKRPDDGQLLNQLAYQWAVRHERLEEALVLIERAVSQEADNGYYLDTRGWVLYKLGRFDEASNSLADAETSLGRSAIVLLHRGDALFRLGDRNGARNRWERARRAFQRTPMGEDPELRASAVGVVARINALKANQPVPVSPTAAEGPPEF